MASTAPFSLTSVLNGSNCSGLTTTVINNLNNDQSFITEELYTHTLQPSANTGLLGNYSGWAYMGSSNTYMDFPTLNNPSQRDSWLTARYNYLKERTYIVNAGTSNEKTKYIIPQLTDFNTIKNNLNYAPSELDPVAGYNQEIVNFLNIISNEYCFYQKRYFVALDRFLQAYVDANNGQTTAIGTLQSRALTLNQKVNTHISFVNYLSAKNIVNLNEREAQIGTLNNQIRTSTEQLRKQADILTNYNKSNSLFREMTEYTEQKNRANQNLLAVYFTLNVVAIASLFIIARSL